MRKRTTPQFHIKAIRAIVDRHPDPSKALQEAAERTDVDHDDDEYEVEAIRTTNRLPRVHLERTACPCMQGIIKYILDMVRDLDPAVQLIHMGTLLPLESTSTSTQYRRTFGTRLQ